MNIIIIEDELTNQIILQKLLLDIDSSINILSTTESITDTVKWLVSNKPPDLIFMDIKLSDGMCFEIFDKCIISSPVIFTTSLDEYAMKAFETNCIDFLLKPIDKEKLEKSLHKYQILKNNFINSEMLNSLTNALHQIKNEQKTYKSRYLVYNKDNLLPIDTKDIVCFYSEDKITFMITNKGNKHIINDSLDHIEKELDPKFFFRVNRQYIIALKYITKIQNTFNYKVKIALSITTDKDIITSRDKTSLFKNWLNQ